MAKVVGPSAIVAASKMYGKAVFFLKSEAAANTAIERGLAVAGIFIPVEPLAGLGTRVVLSNVPPFLKDDLLRPHLQALGEIKTSIHALPLGCKDQPLRHVLSFRHKVTIHLAGREVAEGSFVVPFEGTNYVIFYSSEEVLCFHCKELGHQKKRCPKLKKSAKPPAQTPHPSESTSPPGPSKKPAEGGKKVPAPLPVTSREGKGEKAPEAAGPSAPSKTEPVLTLVSGARKGGEEPKRAEGGALEVDPLPEVQRGQIPVTEGAREEPLKEQPPRASLSGGDEGSGPCAAVGGGTSPEAVPVTNAEGGEGPERVYPLSLGEGGEGPERVDPLPSRAEDGPETVPRTSKEGPRAGTKPSGSAAYAERLSAPPKSRMQTVPARVPPPISPAASPGGGVLGESVKIKIRCNALTQQRECIVLLHREGVGGEPEERETTTASGFPFWRRRGLRPLRGRRGGNIARGGPGD
ncbi:UNVERIFIED_CONTAM: hypothetical protein FKN15_067632 [Acipenser sinensis]